MEEINETNSRKLNDIKSQEDYFEKVREVGVVATILRLKIREVLELRFDLKQEVHHFFFSGFA